MNRVRKFRAWHFEKKDMSYLDWFTMIYDDGGKSETDKTFVRWSFWDALIDGLGEALKEPQRRCVVNYKNGVLMEFTGIYDKNGKEIYEGDRCINSFGEEIVIEFSGGCFGFYKPTNYGRTWFNLSNSGDDFEVIGNIYEGGDSDG